jgi:hypothetical protein
MELEILQPPCWSVFPLPFINDFPDVVLDKSRTAPYADDSKVYESISSMQCRETLQQSLDSLNTWSYINNMSFNASKCKVLTVTRKLNPVNFDYRLADKTLTPVREEKDLGVVITSNFTWDHQILAVVSKANKMLALLRRTCPLIKDTRVRRSLYLSLVKCHLNYATEVWSPAHISLKRKVENVQRRATRWILQQRMGQQEYKDRLVTLDLLPLCYDRELKDLIFFYKASRGYIDIHISSFVSFVNNGRTRSSHLRTLKTPSYRSSTFLSSYFKLWNKTILVAPPRNLSSLLLFKRSIKDLFKLKLNRTFDLSMPCTCHGLSCLTVLAIGNQVIVNVDCQTEASDDIPR